MLMGADSCLKVVGSNPSTVYLMDMFYFLLIFVVKCNVC